jgi:hypothetical protein
MGRIIVTVLATLFVVGIIYHFFPVTTQPAFSNTHGISWLLCLGAVVFVGAFKLTSK